MSSPKNSEFKGGQISEHVREWQELSGDKWLLDTVRGVVIPFVEIPMQTVIPKPFKLSTAEQDFVDCELQVMLGKGIVERVEPLEDQVLSNIFLRPKKDGSYRFILDLTWVNLHVEYEHFKMCSIQTALDMIRPDAWMGSIDLKDAYYSVLVAEEFRKFLRFTWRGELFQFRVLPNGLACAPRIFTKLLNPVFASLREEGCESFPYIDDSFVISDTLEGCRRSLDKLEKRLEYLGFVIHKGKSVLEPSKELVFLGFMLNSEEFRVFLTEEKEKKLIRAAKGVLAKRNPSIREIAGLLGLMVAFAQAFKYAEGHLKRLEIEKIEALRESKGDFDAKMTLGKGGREDIHWWLQNVGSSGRPIRPRKHGCVLFTDASSQGWGAHLGDKVAGGRWSEEEEGDHINILELRAIEFGLKSLGEVEDSHIRIMTDNTTALAYVKHQGGVKARECNEVALEIWNWAEARDKWLTIAHIPGVQNTVADFKSRVFADNLEWELRDALFQTLIKVFGKPDIDLFASRLNKKVPVYVSWLPEPEAYAIDAFTIAWTQCFFYAFPPFSCVGRAVEKAIEERASGMLVVPWWPTKPWWGRLVSLGLRKIKFRAKKGNLVPRGNPDNAPFVNRIPLGVFLFSEKNC